MEDKPFGISKVEGECEEGGGGGVYERRPMEDENREKGSARRAPWSGAGEPVEGVVGVERCKSGAAVADGEAGEVRRAEIEKSRCIE